MAIEIADPNKIAVHKYVLEFDYVNYRGETAKRKAIPSSVQFGMTEYHPEPQWLMFAFCLDRMEYRNFAMQDMSNVVVHLG